MDADEIRAMRLRLGLSQEAFAPVLGVSMHTVNCWERGKRKPSRLAMEKIKAQLEKEKKNECR